MRYILLTGFSEKNKAWAQDLRSKLISDGIDLEYLEWAHWENGGRFNIELEQKRIKKLIGKDNVTMLAKSVGTIALASLIPSRSKQIKSIILMGIPVNELTHTAMEKYLSINRIESSRVKVIQNSGDPYGDFLRVRELIHEINPEVEVIEADGVTHDYPYPELLSDLIKEIS